MITFSFSFAEMTYHTTGGGNTYKLSNSTKPSNVILESGTGECGQDYYQAVNLNATSAVFRHWVPQTYIAQYRYMCTYQDNFYGFIPDPAVDCPSGIVDGECSVAPPPNPPECYLGTHNDPANPQNCIDDFPITKTDYLEGGGVLIHYDDNKIMLLRRDGTGESWDLTTGEYFFPNRAFDGVVPPSASYNPFSFDKSQAIQYKELTFGDVAGIAFNQAGVAIKDAANWLQAPALVWTLALSTHKDTPTDSLVNSGTNVSLVENSSNNYLLSSFESSSNPQIIPNTDIVVQKVNSDIGSFSSVSNVGDTIITSNSNPNKAIIDTSSAIKFEQKNPDGSILETIIQKSDISSTSLNNTDLNFQISTVSNNINNDGTTTKTVIPTLQGSVSSSTGTTTSTNSTTGITTIVTNPTTGTSTTAATTSPSGTGTIDLSGVTARLDKISNQLTAVNNFNSSLKDATASQVSNPIDNEKGQGLIDTFSTSWNNIKADFDRITVMTDEATSTINNGFSLSLATGVVSECPYISDFDYVASTAPIPVDLCKVFSPLRSTLYVLFTLLFQFFLISFAFKSLIKLV